MTCDVCAYCAHAPIDLLGAYVCAHLLKIEKVYCYILFITLPYLEKFAPME